MAIVSGNVGRGIVGCGDGGGVWRFRWFVMAASMISTVVSSSAVIVGEEIGVDMVVVVEGWMFFFVVAIRPLYILGCSFSHRV